MQEEGFNVMVVCRIDACHFNNKQGFCYNPCPAITISGQCAELVHISEQGVVYQRNDFTEPLADDLKIDVKIVDAEEVES